MALVLKKGILAQSTPAATSLTTAYTVGANKCASAAVSICNRNAAPASVRVAVVSAAGTTTSYIIYDETLPGSGQPNSYMEVRAVVLGPDERIQVYSTVANTDFLITGVESPNDMAAFDA